MMFINSLLSHASDEYWDEFISKLESLNIRKAVVVRQTFQLLLQNLQLIFCEATHVFTYNR